MPNFFRNNNSVASAVIFMLMFVIYTAMFALTPYQIDDIIFQSVYLDHNGGDSSFSLGALVKFVKEIREYDNCRIANILSPFSTMFVPWKYLFPFAVAGCMCALVWLTGRFARIGRSDYATYAAIWLVLAIFLPWRNALLVADYALNYFFAGVISMLTLLLLNRGETRGWTPRLLIAGILSCFLAGGWHEGFAVPTIAGLGVVALRHKLKMSRQWYFLVIFYFAVACVFALSPGMLRRAANENGQPLADSIKTLADLSLCVILLGAIFLELLTRRGRQRLGKWWADNLWLASLTAMLVASYISLRYIHTPRTAFYPELLAAVCLFRMYGNKIADARQWVRILATCVALLLLVGHACITIGWLRKLNDENNAIWNKLRTTSTGTVFHDVIMPEDIPVTTLFYPPKSTWVTGFQYQCVRNLMHDERMAVVPTALAHADTLSARPLGSGIYETGGNLFGDYIPIERIEKPISVRFTDTDGNKIYFSPTFIINFETREGKKYTYYKIYKQDISKIRHIDAIDL